MHFQPCTCCSNNYILEIIEYYFSNVIKLNTVPRKKRKVIRQEKYRKRSKKVEGERKEATSGSEYEPVRGGIHRVSHPGW
jgi:hypothetical protein